MPIEPKLIADFPKCPWCGSEERVSEMASAEFKEKGKIPKEAFTALRRAIVPLEQPALAGVMVSCIFTSYDVCGGCGRDRCTKVEIIQAPVQMGQPQQVFRNQPGQKGGFQPR